MSSAGKNNLQKYYMRAKTSKKSDFLPYNKRDEATTSRASVSNTKPSEVNIYCDTDNSISTHSDESDTQDPNSFSDSDFDVQVNFHFAVNLNLLQRVIYLMHFLAQN